jgi:hypothetical protein
LEHLEAIAIEGQISVLKKKPNQINFEEGSKLALPKLASQGIAGICNE